MPARKLPRDVQAAFGRAIRAERERKGLSQEKLAELAEIHRTYAGDVERGERNVAIVNMFRIACGLGLPLSRLIARAERDLSRTRR